MSLAQNFVANPGPFERIILVSPEATKLKYMGDALLFDAFLNEEEDRARLIAFLKEKNIGI
jgi:hypothetical protein